MKIAIYGNFYQNDHIEAVGTLFEALAAAGAHVEVEAGFYGYLRTIMPVPAVDGIISDGDFSADIVFSIGGDGTFLHAAAWVGNKGIPIAGINTGHLGYLADVPIAYIQSAVEEILRGEYKIEARSLLRVEIDALGVDLPCPFALNEVAVQKNDTASMLRVKTWVDGKELAVYLGDGLIVSTPTGSTAYNLSVGGPVLHPGCHNWVISPIAAHSLTMRPLVLPDDRELRIKVESSRSQSFLISIDGKSVALPMGESLSLKKAEYSVKVVQLASHDFAKTLRNKLMWGADAR